LPTTIGGKNHPRFQGENFQKNLDLVRRVEALARENGARPASSRSHGCWPRGTTSSRYPAPSIESTWGKRRRPQVTLSGAELAQIEDVGSAAGARYPEGGMRTVNG